MTPPTTPHASRFTLHVSRLDPGWFVVLILTLSAVYPLRLHGLPNSADGAIHLMRAVEFDLAWRDGVYYPRWAADMAFGLGAPLFNFAPPLLYVCTQLIHLFGPSLADAMRLTVILFFFAYGLGMYGFGRALMGPRAGLVAAAAYLYVPYRLREAYIQGNYAQFLALAFLPWILWAFYRVVTTGRRAAIVGGALAYAGLLLSHNISAMLFTPLLVVYVAFLLLRRSLVAPRALRAALLTFGLGLALSAFFWLPAFGERQWIQLAGITRGHFDFRGHFLSLAELFSPPAPLDYAATNPRLPLSLGLAPIVLGALALLALLRWRALRPTVRVHVVFFALTLAGCVFMMLPVSTPLWEHLPLLRLAEFPWRIMGLVAVPVAVLAGASVHLWERSANRRAPTLSLAPSFLVASLLVTLLTSFPYLFPLPIFIPYDNLTAADVVRFERDSGAVATTSTGEFLPVWAEEHPTTSPLVSLYESGRPIVKLDESSLPAGAVAEPLLHTVRADEYRLSSPRPFTARFNTLYYPAWRAYLDSRPVDVGVTSPQGLIEVAVPAGEHRLALRFENTPLSTIGNGLSIAALLAVFLSLGWRLPKSPRLRKSASHLPAKEALWCAAALLALFVVTEAYVGPHTLWFRHFSPPERVIGVQHPAYTVLEGGMVFLGYDLDGDTVRQGDSLRVTLYWKAPDGVDVDYSSFAHLSAPPDGTTVASSDHWHPGGVPTSRWHPRLYTRDEHLVKVPPDAWPIAYALRVGLYDRETGRRLKVVGQDGDALDLQPIHVLAAHPPDPRRLPHRTAFTLGDRIELLGYDLEAGSWKLEAGMRLTLYWRAREPVEKDYTVFVHVLGPSGELLGQRDSPPVDGRYPTSAWRPGQVIADRHEIARPDGAPAGPYRLAVGMYDLATLERLPVVDSAGRPVPEDSIILDVGAAEGE